MTAISPTVELYLGSLGWTVITSKTRQEAASSGGGTTIVRGRANGAAVSEPGSATAVIDNRDGRFSPRNPNSEYYGLLGRNTPIRIRLPEADPGTAVALPGRITATGSGGLRVTTPDHASLDITGDIDIRFWGRHPGHWSTPNGMLLAGKFGASSDQSWFLSVGPDRRPRFAWSSNGTSTAGQFWQGSALTSGVGGELAVRVTLDVDNGAGGWTLRFYQASTLAGTWTQVGVDITAAGVTSIYSGASSVEIGGESSVSGDAFNGELYGFELRNGIAGTVVASPDFTAMEVGDTVLTDAQGRVYTLDAGALVVDRGARFYGEVSSWPARWNLPGTDVWVPITAAGITRRLGQGSSPVRSPLYRTFLATAPAAYLPLEEGSAATAPASAAEGVEFGEATEVSFGADTSLGGATSTVKMNSTSSRIATSVVQRSSTIWAWFLVFKLPAIPAGGYLTFARVYMVGGTVATWDMQVSSGGYKWVGTDAWGVTVASQSYAFSSVEPDGWVAMATQLQQVGVDVQWGPVFHQVGSTSFFGGYASFSYTGTIGWPVSVELLGNTYTANGLFGHLVVNSATIPLLASTFAAVSTGYPGETAGQRIYRLCQEAGVPVIMQGAPVYTEPMGPQGGGTLLDLLREAEAVDGGILTESRGQLGLQYRSRVSLYNQTPLQLSYAAGHISPPFEPVDDDQGTRNDVTVKRDGGGSYRAVQDTGPLSTQDSPDGVGRYDTSVTLALNTDAQTLDHAWWRLHLGTVDEARWPRIGINLLAPAWQADPDLTQQAALVDTGDLVTVDDLPAWVPPGPAEALVQGYTETIDSFRWEITWAAQPGTPWRVFTVADGDYGRVDTGGSELASSATSSATSLSVATTEGPIWTPDPDDWPFDVNVAGECCRVTGVGANLISNGDFESGTSGWSTSSGTLTQSTVRSHEGTASALFVPNGVSASASMSATSAAQVPVTAGLTYLAQVWLYANNAYTDACPAIDWYTSGSVFISTSLTSSQAISAGVWTLRNIAYTAPAGAAFARLRAVRLGGTAPSSLNVWVDQARLVLDTTAMVSPQTFEVTRSVNQVVKAHAAGTPVSLWRPPVVAL